MGIAIPLGILILVALLVVVIKIYKKKEAYPEDENRENEQNISEKYLGTQIENS